MRQRTPLATLFPPFIVGFLLVALANSLRLLPDFTLHLQDSALWQAGDLYVSVARLATQTSLFLVTVAMAGVGLGVSLRGLLRVGLSAASAGLASTLILATLALALVLVFL